MTFVGKILVITIMAFALIFLALSTVVFTTSKNWMVATKTERAKVEDIKNKLNDAKAGSEAAKKALEDYKAQCDQEKKAAENSLASRDDEIKRNLAQIQTARGQLAVAQQTAKSSLEEAEAKRNETLQLRTALSAVEKQANELKLEQAEKNDKIRDLTRQLETATKNNSTLRDTVAKYVEHLTKNGLSTDIAQLKGLASPPPVTGEIKRVDPARPFMEITIGSDDGLVVGHELYMYRLSPRPEYLGKVKIVSVDPDQAVAKVVGKTYMGKKIKEGDIVSSTINPRF
jgi:F0F1-type ATP synthase membrane subunit b/b'